MPDTTETKEPALCPRCKGGGGVNDRGVAPDPAASPTGIDLAVSACPDCGGTGKVPASNGHEGEAVHPIYADGVPQAIRDEYERVCGERDKYQSWHQRADGEAEREMVRAEKAEAALEVERRRVERLREGLRRVLDQRLTDLGTRDPATLARARGDAMERMIRCAQDALASLNVGEPEPALSSDSVPNQSTLVEFDAWLSFRPEFGEVLMAFRSAFGTDTSAAADDGKTESIDHAAPSPVGERERCCGGVRCGSWPCTDCPAVAVEVEQDEHQGDGVDRLVAAYRGRSDREALDFPVGELIDAVGEVQSLVGRYRVDSGDDALGAELADATGRLRAVAAKWSPRRPANRPERIECVFEKLCELHPRRLEEGERPGLYDEAAKIVDALAGAVPSRFYPYVDGDFTAIGPECFAGKNDAGATVVSWKGENYVRQGAVPSVGEPSWAVAKQERDDAYAARDAAREEVAQLTAAICAIDDALGNPVEGIVRAAKKLRAQPEREDGEPTEERPEDALRRTAGELIETRAEVERLEKHRQGLRQDADRYCAELKALRASKPLSTDVLRNPSDAVKAAVVGYVGDSEHLAELVLKDVASAVEQQADEHPSPSLSEQSDDGPTDAAFEAVFAPVAGLMRCVRSYADKRNWRGCEFRAVPGFDGWELAEKTLAKFPDAVAAMSSIEPPPDGLREQVIDEVSKLLGPAVWDLKPLGPVNWHEVVGYVLHNAEKRGWGPSPAVGLTVEDRKALTWVESFASAKLADSGLGVSDFREAEARIDVLRRLAAVSEGPDEGSGDEAR